MADFRARILAELDASRIQGDLDNIGRTHTLTLRNIGIDQNSINNVIRQIQRSLDNHQFNINVNYPNSQQNRNNGNNPPNNPQNPLNGVQQGLNKVLNNSRSEIFRMQTLLKRMNFDSSSIDMVTRDLDQMNLAISRVVTNVDRNNNLRVSIRGIDEFGNVVTQIKQFDNINGHITDLGKTIAQSFDTGEAATRAFNEETQYAYSRMQELHTELKSLSKEELKLNPVVDYRQLDAVRERIANVTAEYDALSDIFYDRFTPLQQNNLWKNDSDINFAIDKAMAKRDDKNSVKNLNRDFNELYETAKRLSGIRLQLLDLDAKEDAEQIKILSSELRKYGAIYNQLKSSLNGRLTKEQRHSLDELGRTTKDKRRIRQAEIVDENKLSQEKAAADALEKSYDELYNTAQKISKTRIDIAKLDSNKNSSEIEVLNNRLEELRNTYNALETSLSGKLSVDQFQRLQQVILDTEDELDRLAAKSTDKNNKLASVVQIGNLDNKMAVWLSKNSKAAKDYGSSIDALRGRMKELSSSGEMLESDLKNIEQEFKDITVAATLAGKTGKSFADVFQSSIERITQYITIDRIFEHLVDSLKDMGQNVLDIDTAMTGLKKVTDETSVRYDQFLKNSASSAKELKRSISGIIEQSAEWAKLGYSIDEAEELAKLSSVYANVADVDNSTAVSDMVTAMKAFSIESQDAITIIDSMNQLGNQFATDAASLGEGLSRAASSMHVAGTDMYQTLAMLTGGAEITQNAGEFGNFLKVASMRIRGMTGELEALGEEVDESVESISKIQTQILNLTHGKVNIFDSEGEFRNYFEVMKEIADVMDELSSTEQASMTELLFGKQRGNQGAALIQAFQSGQIEKAYQSAINSAGSAMAEQEKWSQSLEAHLGELKATWQEVSQTFLDSEFLKGAVDVATTLLERLVDIGELLDGDGFFGSFGLFPTVISGIVGAIASFKDIGIFKVIENEAEESSIKISKSLTQVFGKTGVVYSEKIQKDADVLYDLLNSVSNSDAYNSILTNASDSVKEFANDVNNLNNNAIDGFIDQQKNLELRVISSNKSLGNCCAILNEYNNRVVDGNGNSQDFIDAINVGNPVMGQYIQNLNGAKGSIGGYIGILVKAKAATIGLKIATAALNMGVSLIAGLAIQGISKLITHVVTSGERAIKTAEELRLEYEKSSSTYSSNIEKLEGMREKFNLLSEDVDENGKNINLTAEEYKEYLSIINDIVDVSPDVCKGYDNEGNAIVDYKKVLDQAIESQKKYLANEKEIYVSNGDDIFKGAKARYKEINKEISKFGNKLNNAIYGSRMGEAENKATRKAFHDALEYAGVDWTTGKDNFTDSYDKLLEIYENRDKVLQSFRASGVYTKEEIADIEQAILKLSSSYSDLNTEINSVSNNLSTWASTQDWYQTIPIDALDEFAEGIRGIIDLNGSYETNRNNVLNYGEAYATASQKVSELAKQIKAAADEYNKLINGNVDYNRRPMIDGDRMRKFYPEFDGDVATTYSQYQTIGEGEFLYTIDITPILEDGTILDQESLDEYIRSLVTGNGIEGILESDKENLIINVVPGDYDKAYWDEYQKNLQAVKDEHAELYSQMGNLTAGDANLENYADSLLAVGKSAKTTEEEFVSISDTLQDYRKVLFLLKQASDEYKRTGSVTFDTYNAVSKVGKEYAELFTIADGKVKLATDSLSDFVDKLVQSTGATLISHGATEEQIYLVSSLAEGFKDLTEESDAAIESIKELLGYLGNIGDGKQYSSTELWDLIHAYPELSRYITETSDGYRIEEEGIRKVIAARKELAILNGDTEAKTKARNTLDQNARSGQTSQMVDDVFARYEKETGKQIEFFEEFEQAWSKYNNLSKPINGWVDGLEDYVDATIDQNALIKHSNRLMEEDFSNPGEFKDGATETSFEKEYKQHQHYLELGQESEEEYLAWLVQAYETAYNDGIIQKEEDYLKYKEEAYNLNKTLFQNSLAKTEERISVLSESEDNVDEIVSLYEGAQEEILHQMEGARRAGESENNEYLQELRRQWLEYENAISQLHKDTSDGAIDSISGLVDILDEQKEGTEYSTLAILDMIEQYPELVEHITKTANGYKIEEDAIKDLIKQKSQLIMLDKIESKSTTSARDKIINEYKNEAGAELIDDVFQKYYAQNEKWIQSEEEFIAAYEEQTGRTFGGKWASGIQALILSRIKDGENLEITADILKGLSDFDNLYLEGIDPSDSKKDKETEFERQYKLHNHLLNMDKESIEDYLAWLRVAYIASYNAGEMELDDFYKYKEEVYEKDKELFADSLSDMEHQISLLGNANIDNSDEIVSMYEDMQRRVHEKANEYRAAGLDDNHEILQELQNQWWSYEQAIEKIREEEFDSDLDKINFNIDTLKLDNANSNEILSSYQDVLRRINEEIDRYTSEGYDISHEKIRDLTTKLRDTKDEIIDYLNEIVEKANDAVDGYQNVYTTLTDAAKEYASTGALSVDSFQSILELGPKYLSFLYDENGQLTINKESIKQVIAAKTEELAVETALAYAKQVLQAAQENNIAKIVELTSVSAAGTASTWEMAYATLGLAKAIGTANGMDASYFDNAADNLAKIQSMSKTAVNTIDTYYATLEDGYVSQADGLNTIIELTQDMIKWENEQLIDALEKEKEDYSDIIDQKKELIRLAKEQADRESSVADKLEKAAKLQSQIAQLALDDDREAQAQRRSLEEQLAELQKEISKEQADHSFELQEEALDKELEAFEDAKDDEIEKQKNMLQSTEALYQAAIERIDSDWETLYDQLIDYNFNYGSMLESDLTAAWDAATAAVERYGSVVEAKTGLKNDTDLGEHVESSSGSKHESYTAASSKGKDIKSRMRQNSIDWFTSNNQKSIEQDQQKLAEEWYHTFGERLTSKNGSWYRENGEVLYTLTDEEVGKAVVSKMEANAAAWHTASESERARLEAENERLKTLLENFLGVKIKKTLGGVWMLGNRELFDVYHTGGVVGGGESKKEKEVLALLEEGELVLTKQMKSTLLQMFDSSIQIDSGMYKNIGSAKQYASEKLMESLAKYEDTMQNILDKIGFVTSGKMEQKIEVGDIYAPVNVVKELTEDEIRKHAKQIGELSAGHIREAFTKLGIKRTASLL